MRIHFNPDPAPDPLVPAGESVLTIPGRTWVARSAELTTLSGHVPGDGSFAPYLFFATTTGRANVGSVVTDDWTGEGRWVNNYIRYHTDRYLLYSITPPADVYTQLDAWFGVMDPVLSIHNDAENNTNGKQFTYGVTMSGLGYSAADLGYVPTGVENWRARCIDILDGNVSGSLGTVYRNNHNYRAACINVLAATNAAYESVDDQLAKVIEHLDDSIPRTLPASDGTRNYTEENRDQSIHYDLLELGSFCQAIAYVRQRGSDISTLAQDRISARAAAMWPFYLDYVAAAGGPAHYTIGGVARSETGTLFTPANAGPPMEWLVALGFHPGPVPASVQHKESPMGFSGQVPW